MVISAAEYQDQDILIVNTADVTESLEKEAQLIQAGKMTTLGVMAAGMAHEINQPLNVIQICADYFLKTLKKQGSIPPDDLKKMTLNIAENVDRASKVIKRSPRLRPPDGNRPQQNRHQQAHQRQHQRGKPFTEGQ